MLLEADLICHLQLYDRTSLSDTRMIRAFVEAQQAIRNCSSKCSTFSGRVCEYSQLEGANDRVALTANSSLIPPHCEGASTAVTTTFCDDSSIPDVPRHLSGSSLPLLFIRQVQRIRHSERTVRDF